MFPTTLFRPVSIVSILSKMFEILVVDQIKYFLEPKLFSMLQFGFCELASLQRTLLIVRSQQRLNQRPQLHNPVLSQQGLVNPTRSRAKTAIVVGLFLSQCSVSYKTLYMTFTLQIIIQYLFRELLQDYRNNLFTSGADSCSAL